MPIAKSNGAVATPPAVEKPAVAQTAPAPVSRKLDTGTDREESKSFESDKNERILRQGTYQAVLQSPGLACFSFANVDEYLAKVESVSEAIINKIAKR